MVIQLAVASCSAYPGPYRVAFAHLDRRPTSCRMWLTTRLATTRLAAVLGAFACVATGTANAYAPIAHSAHASRACPCVPATLCDPITTPLYSRPEIFGFGSGGRTIASGHHRRKLLHRIGNLR